MGKSSPSQNKRTFPGRERIAKFKWELVQRDPDFVELQKTERELAATRSDRTENDDRGIALSNRVHALLAKYNVPLEEAGLTLRMGKPVMFETNFGHRRTKVPRIPDNPEEELKWTPDPSGISALLSPDSPPTLAVAVALTAITQRDLNGLARWFKQRVKECLKEMPKTPGVDPAELVFLRRVSESQFAKGIRYYDLHFRDGRSFGEIARQEHTKADTVRKSVQRIYRAIHRKPYQARRRRLDAPAADMDTYACSLHPKGDCPESCPTMRKWIQVMNRVLPTDYTGRSGREVPLRKTPRP